MEPETPKGQGKVGLLVTAGRFVDSEFAYRLALNVGNLAPFANVLTMFAVNKERHVARSAMMKAASGAGCDVLIFLDDDVVLNPYSLNRLAFAKETLVGMNFLEPGPKGLIFSARKGIAPVVTAPGNDDLEEVDEIGMRLFALKLTPMVRNAFGGEPESLFYFVGPGESHRTHFAKMMKRVSVSPFVDHGLSGVCGIKDETAIYPAHYTPEA